MKDPGVRSKRSLPNYSQTKAAGVLRRSTQSFGFAEDRCRVRAGARPLASLRNLAISLIRRAGHSISEARENFRDIPTPA